MTEFINTISLDELPYGVYIINKNGYCVYANQAFINIIGYNKQELATMHVLSLIYPKDYKKECKEEANKPVQEETIRFLCKFGQTIWTSVFVINKEINNDCYKMYYVRDVTKKIEMQKVLEKANKDLEHFAYIVSHDLQEPLRTINGFSELLKNKYSKCLDSKGNNYIKYIIEGTKKLDNIIKTVLESSKYNNTDFEKSEINVEQVFNDVLKTMSFSLESVKIHKENLSTIYMNEIHLFQILQNLISNSLKYRNKSKNILNITISMKSEKDKNIICVKDDGIGISKDAQEKLFAMFSRIETRVEGNGIGLALCKKIVNLYQGEIWLESEINAGTTICILMPNKKE